MRGTRTRASTEGVDELRTVVEALPSLGVPKENFAIDLTIARGLDYYTGTVYETTMNSHPEIGSVCSGGRYDNLAEYYTDKQLPGVGMSIGVTRLFYVLTRAGAAQPGRSTPRPCGRHRPAHDGGHWASPPMTATVLRGYGMRTQLYTEEQASSSRSSPTLRKLGIPFAVIIGEDEAGERARRPSRTCARGEQARCTPDEAAEQIQTRPGRARRRRSS